MSAPSTPPPALAEGQVVAGRYRISRLLGRGGMGAVYEAERVELGRRVAIKVLLPEVAADTEVVARFFREARAAASIGHPGIVEVFDLGRDEDIAFLVMEKLDGEELAQYLHRAHPLPVSEVARIGIELADAISAAHAHGIVHRDLKPQNVFLAARPRRPSAVKVLDFGIAKLVGTEHPGATRLTETGRVFGTPLYMAPEQLRNTANVDARADVYALGVVLYESLAGQPPFVATNYPELILAICSGTRTPLRSVRPDVPEAMEAIVSRAMAVLPENRFATARALADALESLGRAPDAALGLARTQPSIAPVAPAPPSVPPRDTTARLRVAWMIGLATLTSIVVAIVSAFPAEQAATPLPSVAAAPAHVDSAVVDALDAAIATELPPAASPRPELRVSVIPRGAEVTLGDYHCTAPCTLPFESAGSVEVAHFGYVTETIAVDPSGEREIEVRLRRATGGSSPPDEPPPLHMP